MELIKIYQNKIKNIENALQLTKKLIKEATKEKDYEQLKFSENERAELLLTRINYFKFVEDLKKVEQQRKCEMLIMKSALEDIVNWNDDLEMEYNDPGKRAKIGLGIVF